MGLVLGVAIYPLCAADVSSAAQVPTGSVGSSAVQAMGYLLGILVLLGAGVVVLLKSGLVGGLNIGSKTTRKLQIEETRMLGHRQYLLVAEYEGRKMLLGVCPGRIDYLCPLEVDAEEGVPPIEFPKIKPEVQE